MAIFNHKKSTIEIYTYALTPKKKKIKIHFADFEQFIIKISHFADFEQVKQYYQQNFHGRNRMPSHFFLRPLPCVTATPHWLVRPMKASTS